VLTADDFASHTPTLVPCTELYTNSEPGVCYRSATHTGIASPQELSLKLRWAGQRISKVPLYKHTHTHTHTLLPKQVVGLICAVVAFLVHTPRQTSSVEGSRMVVELVRNCSLSRFHEGLGLAHTFATGRC